jgi:hypothetical protein
LLNSTVILSKFREHGLLYDSNCFLPYSKNSQPFKLWNGLVRIPFNWEDDIHCMYGFSFEDSQIDIMHDGLNVFNFHPIHIYLNTESLERYESAKKYFDNPGKLSEFRNTKTVGVRNLLIDLLEQIRINNTETMTLCEIADNIK